MHAAQIYKIRPSKIETKKRPKLFPLSLPPGSLPEPEKWIYKSDKGDLVIVKLVGKNLSLIVSNITLWDPSKGTPFDTRLTRPP